MEPKTTEGLESNSKFAERAASLARVCAIGVVYIGFFSLLNWLISDQVFTTLKKRSFAVMNPSSAMSFILIGIYILLATSPWRRTRYRTIKLRIGLACFVIFSAILKISTFLTAKDFDLDRLLFIYNSKSTVMAPNTAIAFLMCGMALFTLQNRSPKGIRAFVSLVLGVLVISSLAVIGHSYKIATFYQVSNFVPMPISTAFTFILVALSMLFTRPKTEPMATVLSNTLGGIMGRRLLPVAFAVPFLIGWLVFWADRNSYLEISSGMTLFVLSNSLVFVSLIWWNARHLYRLDSETKHLMQLLSQKAMIDGLTGVWNRAHFDQRLNAEIQLLKRSARSFSCILVDVDHFKSINDTYGHQTGDEVLRQVAQVLMETSRDEDVVCRYGGEEFVIISPGTKAAGAAQFAERIRKEVEKKVFQYEDAEFHVTCSFGVAEATLENDAVIKTADAALYRAKNSGRNRVAA